MFHRSAKNPILKPDKKHNWESHKVYNCAAIYEDGKYHLFYRAIGKDWVSRLGYAWSKDGKNFVRSQKPVLVPESKWEKQGVEDPRISNIGDTFYLTYTAFDSITARLNFAVSKNLKSWRKQGKMLPNWNWQKAGGFLVRWDEIRTKTGKDWSKAGAIFPQKIQGKYWLLFGDSNIWLVNSKDGLRWQPILKPFLKPRKEKFDSAHLEMGPPPIKTEKGWLVLYHGIDKTITYRLGFLLLDLENPRKILYRSEKPILEPQALYELGGLIDILPGGLKAMSKMSKRKLSEFVKKYQTTKRQPTVIFCCGAILKDNQLRIYYGAGDSFICTATANVKEILKYVG